MKISIRGQTFDYPVYDLDAMAHSVATDAVLKSALDAAVGAGDGMPTMEQQEAMFAAYTAYFDAMLGDGALSRILNGKRNVMDAVEAYYDFRDAVSSAMVQRANEVGARAKIPDKYNPDNIRE